MEAKEKKKIIPFGIKKPKEKRDIYRWKRINFSSEVEITKEIV